MANDEHLERLKTAIGNEDIHGWNLWRSLNPDIRVNVSEADLTEANLSGADLTEANLRGVDLSEANLSGADLKEADLRRTDLSWANLSWADLTGAKLISADLTGANLTGANLSETDLRCANLVWADLTGAKLIGADLTGTTLLNTKLEKADLNRCRVYAISAWNVKLEGAVQEELVITLPGEPEITVSDLEVAQFIYLLVFNPKIRRTIDTITSKVVLILGRFTEERKAILNALRDALRHRELVPVVFHVDKPTSRDLTDTVRTLAHMARFIVADITDPKSIPQELTTIIPHLPSVPVQTLVLRSDREYAMYEQWKQYRGVLPIFRYRSVKHLVASIEDKVIAPAERRNERRNRR